MTLRQCVPQNGELNASWLAHHLVWASPSPNAVISKCIYCLKASASQIIPGYYLCARKIPHALRPSLRRFPNVAFKTVPMFLWPSLVLSKKIVERFLFSRLSPPGDRWCGIPLVLRAQKVSSSSTLPSETQTTCVRFFARQSVCSVVPLHSGMSRAVHPQGFPKVDVDQRHMLVSASHSTCIFFFFFFFFFFFSKLA